MAFSFFGKKDKNPPETSAPVAKAPPTPPKIQTPPAAPSIPAVKPPQPSGLIPTSGMPSGAATTQPMVMPRTGGTGLKPTRPGVVQSNRSTQRIVLPGGGPGKPAGTKSLSMAAPAAPAGRINLPIGMILRCLPQEVLAADLAEFESNGTASTEIGLPMNMILSQLPSGKVEMSLADLVPHFPPGFLHPTASITNYLPTVVSLPLMDVVMRIPPDLLALRPDQKGVDASVINMADPFTEEILREQAEAARKQQAQTNIIEESQVAPTEEFVPQGQTAASKSIAPPPRPSLSTMSPATASGAQAPASPARLPGSVVSPSPSLSARMISPSGSLTAPTRATAAIPARPQGAVTSQLQPPLPPPPLQPTTQIPSVPTVPVRIPAAMPSAPVPPVPRQTSALPMPPTHVSVPPPQPAPPPAPVVAAAPVSMPAPASVEPIPAPAPAPQVPSTTSDDLQRLAALAMAQMGEAEEPSDSTAALPIAPLTVPIPPSEPSSAEAYPVTQPIPEVPPAPVEASLPPSAPQLPVAATIPIPQVTAAPAAFTPPPPAPVFTPPPVASIPPPPVAATIPIPQVTAAPAAFIPPPPAPVVPAPQLPVAATTPIPEVTPPPVAFIPPPPAPVVAPVIPPPPSPVAAPAPVAATPAPTLPSPVIPAPEPVPVAPVPVGAMPPPPVPVASPEPPPVAPIGAPAPVVAPALQTPTSVVNPEAVAPPLVPPAPIAVTPPLPAPGFANVPAPVAPVSAPAPVAAPVVKAPTSIVNPEAVAPAPQAAAPAPESVPQEDEEEEFNLNSCSAEDLLHIPGCHRELAEAIIRHRALIGSYQKVEDLLDVPGITKEAYTSLTGEAPPPNRIPLTLNELLGFPPEQLPSLKDVTDRICCWPDVTGCVLSQGTGLSLVGTTPAGLDKAALVAFVPKMFDTLNKSFLEVAGRETNDLIIPTTGTSFHILRDNDLYLIILSRLPLMPERHLKVARFVLAALNMRMT